MKYDSLTEFKAAFDRCEFDQTRLVVLIDNDRISASLLDPHEQLWESEHFFCSIFHASACES